MAGITGRHHSSSDQCPSQLGQLIETALARTRELMGQDCWPTLCQLGPGNESAWITRRPNSSLNLGPCRPEQQVVPAAIQTRDESLGTADRRHSSSDKGPCRPGQLSDPASARSRDQMVQERWSTLCKLGHGTESGRIAGQNHSPSVPGPSRPEQQDDPESSRTRTELARTAGPPHSCSDPDPRGTGQLIDPTAPRTQFRVGRDIWWTLQLLGPGTALAGITG